MYGFETTFSVPHTIANDVHSLVKKHNGRYVFSPYLIVGTNLYQFCVGFENTNNDFTREVRQLEIDSAPKTKKKVSLFSKIHQLFQKA